MSTHYLKTIKNMAKKPIKGFSKKAAKSVNESAGKAVSKRYGKAVMKDDPNNPNRKIGYKGVAKTKLPKMTVKKVGKGASPQAKKASRRAR